MTINIHDSVGLIVAKNLQTAAVFEQVGVDFCNQSRLPLIALCEENELDIGKIKAELEKIPCPKHGDQPSFISMPLDELCDYIVTNHHDYLYRSVPGMKHLLCEAVNERKQNSPELNEAFDDFIKFENIMYRHLELEEKEYFPFISNLVAASSGHFSSDEWNKSAVEYVAVLEDDHRNANGFVNSVCQLIKHDNLKKNASESCLKFAEKMKELQKDIHLHIILEDCILQPGSIRLEKDILINY